MKRFTITFDVSEEKLPTVISLLSGECVNMNVHEIERGPIKYRRAKKATRATTGATTMMADAKKKVLAVFEPGVELYYQNPKLTEAVRQANMAAATISPILSKLLADGKLERPKRGYYRLATSS